MEPSTVLGMLVGLAFFGWLGFKIYKSRKARSGTGTGSGGGGSGGSGRNIKRH